MTGYPHMCISGSQEICSKINPGLNTAHPCTGFPLPVLNRRWRRKNSAVPVFLALAIVLAFLAGPAAAMDEISETAILPVARETPIVTGGPLLTNMTGTSTTIRWITGQPARGMLEYRPVRKDGVPGAWNFASEDQLEKNHRIELWDLQPGQTYIYRINGSTQEYRFCTYPASGPVRFVVYGDTREQLPAWNQSLHALVSRQIAQEENCLFVVHTGDLVNDPADEAEWGRFLAAAGPMLANITFYPVPGNHEGNLTGYGNLFGLSSWYSFECGDITFLIINSNSLPLEEAAAQDRWLDQEMLGASRWTFASLHHPLFSSDEKHWGGFVDVAEKYHPFFQKNRINAVFSGHVHAYEHYESGGIHYFTLGTGGAPFYPLSPEKPTGFQTAMENTLAYARVTVDRDTALVEIIPVALVRDGTITPYPPGLVAERVIMQSKGSGLMRGFPQIQPFLMNPFGIPA